MKTTKSTSVTGLANRLAQVRSEMVNTLASSSLFFPAIQAVVERLRIKPRDLFQLGENDAEKNAEAANFCEMIVEEIAVNSETDEPLVCFPLFVYTWPALSEMANHAGFYNLIEEANLLRADLCLANEGLVYKLAQKFGTVTDELLAAARIGLVKAIDKYDPAKMGLEGVTPSFSGFAGYWINAELIAAAQRNDIAKVCYRDQQRVSELRQALTAFAGKGVAVDAETLATYLQWSVKKVESLLPLARLSVSSLDAPIGDDDGGAKFGDSLADPGVTPEEALLVREQEALAHTFLGLLSPRDQQIVRMKMEGVADLRIAQSLGLTKERIGQLYTAALVQLQNSPLAQRMKWAGAF